MPNYRVTHGNVKSGGAMHSKGAVLQMTEANAASLGSSVELVKEAPKPAAPDAPKPFEPTPVLATESRPVVEAPKPPHKGKDKSK